MGEQLDNTVYVSPKIKRVRRLPRVFRRNWRRILIVAVAICVLAVGYYYLVPAVRIGSININRTKYAALKKQAMAVDVKAKDVKDRLIELKKHEIIAKKLKIEISDAEVLKFARTIYTVEGDKLTEWQKLNGFSLAMQNQIALNKDGYYKGLVVYFPFARYFDTTDSEPDDPNFGNTQAIADDKQYALSQAREAREKLASGQITENDLLNQVIGDKRLIFGGSGNPSEVFFLAKAAFDPFRSYTVNEMSAFKYASQLTGLKKGDITEVLTFKSALSYGALNERRATETAYYFVRLVDETDARPEVQKEFDDSMKNIRVIRTWPHV